MNRLLRICAFSLGLCLFCSLQIFASPSENRQKIHPVDSDLYQAISVLFGAAGKALPSTTGPWSSDELLAMLESVDRGTLSSGGQKVFDYVLAELDDGDRVFKFGLDASVEASWHTDTKNFVRDQDWVRGFVQRKPFLSLELETWPGEHFYGYSSLDVQNNRYNGWGTKGPTSTLWGASALTTNLPLLPPAVLNDLDFNIPYRAFGAFGGSGWSAQFGRERLSWGPGLSGNFVLGDHIPYQNVGRLTTYGKNFKYTFLGSFFPHPKNYYPVMDPATGNIINQRWQTSLESGLSLFLGHRLEWRFFGDKVSFALTEAIMYMSEDNTFDLRILSPTTIFHNYYIRSNANSIISGELVFAPVKGINLYGQVVVDEFALPGEPVPGSSEWALPNGYGYMGGLKASLPIGPGVLYGQAEWAQTDPYLYLRDKGAYSQALGDYGINWVVALREFSNAAGVTYTEDFLGYRYGGDAIVLAGNLGYRKFGSWKLEAKFLRMTHGTHDKWTLWSPVGTGTNPPNVVTPTTTHHTGNNGDLTASARDAVSVTTVAGLTGSFSFTDNLELYAEADWISITNPGNRSSNPAISDIQVTAGLSFSL